MKVIAIFGGFGSQMIKYAFYLDILKKSEDKTCYIDTMLFDEFKMWNGYELDKIFGIDAPKIQTKFSLEELEEIKNSERSHRDYVLNKMCELDYEMTYLFDRGTLSKWKEKKILNLRVYQYSKRLVMKIWQRAVRVIKKENLKSTRARFSIEDKYPDEYINLDGNVYYDEFNHTSDKYFKDSRDKIVESFRFPDLSEEKNLEVSKLILNCNSVAMHIRRTDHMYDNGELFENGYYPKAVKYIEKNVDFPVYFIFSDDPDWCMKNNTLLGLPSSIESVHFVNWNIGDKSFRDMQLMIMCKHNILAISSFSWWGYYLSESTNKKVCAPYGYWLEVEKHL